MTCGCPTKIPGSHPKRGQAFRGTRLAMSPSAFGCLRSILTSLNACRGYASAKQKQHAHEGDLQCVPVRYVRHATALGVLISLGTCTAMLAAASTLVTYKIARFGRSSAAKGCIEKAWNLATISTPQAMLKRLKPTCRFRATSVARPAKHGAM